jgi:ribose transport system permease protein
LLAGGLGPLVALLLVFSFFAVADALQSAGGAFVSVHNLRTILVQTLPVAIAALGMTVIIISGGIDLSAGTALSLSATVLAWLLEREVSAPVAVAACVATGCLAGSVNGVLVCSLRVVPFIITLGTMTCFLGLAHRLAENTTVQPPPDVVPAWLPALVRPIPKPEWLLVAPGAWLLLILAVLLALVLRYTVFGRHVFAVGSSEMTARLCGLHVPGIKIAVYALAGLFVGVAAILQFSRLQIGDPGAGVGMELRIIAAVVIGGGSLSGGRGTVLGTLTGAFIMQIISNGCTHLTVRQEWQDMILGAVIIAAVTVDQYRQRRLGG